MAVIISSCQDEYEGIGKLWSAIADGVFGTGSGFGVEWRTAERVYFLFFGGFVLVLAGGWRWAIVLWGLGTFLIFPNFLRL